MDMEAAKYIGAGIAIGLGAIGRETAKICRGVGMTTLAFDPFLSREEIEAEGDSLKGISEAVRLYKMELVDQSNTQLR